MRSPVRRRPRRLTRVATVAVLASLALGTVTVRSAQAATETVTADYSVSGPQEPHYASGTLYGMTESGALPSDHFYRDISWDYMRAGGAQLDSPGGWYAGKYSRRWAATRAQMLRTQALGGRFVILVHDLYGADSTPIDRFPGDNGDWRDYDAFMAQLIGDVRATGVQVEWDLWNEPDNTPFWGRSQAQYLELWRRGYAKIRAAFPNQLIVGPSSLAQPSPNSAWWNTYLDYVKANNVAPDIYSWHLLPGDPVTTSRAADAMLAQRKLARTRPYQINEYGGATEQNPADGAWNIGRYERAGAYGLRANYEMGPALNDYMTHLVTKTGDGEYVPRGEWWMYKYYGSMTGRRVLTTATPSHEALSYMSPGRLQVLVGGSQGNPVYNLALNRLDATTGIVQNKQVRVVVQQIDYNNDGAVPGPRTISDRVVTLTNNSTSFTFVQRGREGYTVTVLPPSDKTFTTVAIAQHSQQCLDDTNLSLANGTQMQQYWCEGGNQQQWKFRPVTGVANTYTMVNQTSGRCLDVLGSSTATGAPVGQSTCLNGRNQQFTLRKVTYAGSSAQDYQLVARHSGKCVDVATVSTLPRTLIHQWDCNNPAVAGPLNQTWRLLGK